MNAVSGADSFGGPTSTRTSSSTPSELAPRGADVAAGRLAWLTAVLAFTASLAGLLIDGVYTGAASTAAMFRANDLVIAVVLVPVLGTTALLARRGSTRSALALISMLAAVVYTYAYYLFGTGFNDLFLLHVAVFTSGLFALVLNLSGIDVGSVATCFSPRTRVRAVAVLLGLLALGLGGMWISVAVGNALTGKAPAGSELVETTAIVHLGMALDLTLLVPLYAVAACLVWRRAAWGYVLAVVSLLAGLVHQIAYLVAMPFQVAADIPGSVSTDPLEPAIVLVYVAATALLLSGARGGARTPTARSTASVADESIATVEQP